MQKLVLAIIALTIGAIIVSALLIPSTSMGDKWGEVFLIAMLFFGAAATVSDNSTRQALSNIAWVASAIAVVAAFSTISNPGI